MMIRKLGQSVTPRRVGIAPRKRNSIGLSRRPNLPLARRPSTVSGTPLTSARSSIRVLLRVRPPTERELADSRHRDVVEVIDQNLVIFDPKEEEFPMMCPKPSKFRDITKKVHKNLQFGFDHVYGTEDSTQHLYSTSIHELIAHLISGYNCTVFAYGATGAGKTYTMLGNQETPGITPLLMSNLYDALSQLQDADVNISVSYLEIYNEMVNDLLVVQTQVKPLNLHEDGDTVLVSGLSWHRPPTANDLMNMLQLGNQRRTQHPTDANAESSRSHAVFQVLVKLKLAGELRCAKLNMIDLAGSERAAATTNSQLRFAEGANINKSLLSLGNCINALADGLKHVPFRNSKLTRLLKGSLGGNCQTVIIANVSTSSIVYEDTYNTLKYATRAKKIKNKVKKNTASVPVTEQNFAIAKKEIEMLREELLAANAANAQYAEKVRLLEEKLELEVKAVVTPTVSVSEEPIKIQDTQCSILEKEMLSKLVNDLAISTRSLKAAIEQKETLEAQLLNLEYNYMKKLQRIERLNTLNQDATQTKVSALDIKTESQRTNLKGKILLAEHTEVKERQGWLDVCTELGRKISDICGPDIGKFMSSILNAETRLTREQVRSWHAQKMLDLKQTDLAMLHCQYLSAAFLLSKAFYAHRGYGTASPEMITQFENILSTVRQPSRVTFKMDLEASEPMEELAHPLCESTFVLEPGTCEETFVMEPTLPGDDTFVVHEKETEVVPLRRSPRLSPVQQGFNMDTTISMMTNDRSISSSSDKIPTLKRRSPTNVLTKSMTVNAMDPPSSSKVAKISKPSIQQVPITPKAPTSYASVVSSKPQKFFTGSRKLTPIRYTYKCFNKDPTRNKENFK